MALLGVIGVKNGFGRNSFRRQMQKFLETCSFVFGGNFHANHIIAQIVQPYKQSVFIRPGIVG